MSDNTLGTQPKTPNKRAGYLFPEALIRAFLAHQFGHIHDTVDDPRVTFLEELFQQGGDDVVLQVKEWWRQTTKISVTINYPRYDLPMPFVSVVNAGERESEEEKILDDYGGTAKYGVMGGGDGRASYTRELKSLPLSHVTKIYFGSNDQNASIYLYHVAMALLLVNKIEFDRWGGMRNLSIAGSDLEHHPELFPEFVYFKVITLTYGSQFDVPLEKKATIGGVDVRLGTFLNGVDTPDVKAG